jgi:transcriptional regulator with XRE-family HTH domain
MGMDSPPWGKTMAELSSTRKPKAIEKIGRAVLRLRLYRGWSQMDLERGSGVDQTTISRLERGVHRGLSIWRLAAILDALHVGEVVFDKPPSMPQTALELMLYGDRWQRAIDVADRRLNWPKPVAADDRALDDEPARDNDPAWDSDRPWDDNDSAAWFGSAG